MAFQWTRLTTQKIGFVAFESASTCVSHQISGLPNPDFVPVFSTRNWEATIQSTIESLWFLVTYNFEKWEPERVTTLDRVKPFMWCMASRELTRLKTMYLVEEPFTQ
jgi:hypothetical protein